MNDELFGFFKKYQQIQNQLRELVHKHDQAIMNGSDMVAVNKHLNEESIRLSEQEDKLITSFVTDNFNNVLGPGVFFLVTMGNQYPMLSPWIEDIMSKATDYFKNDPYVKDYYKKAQENQEIMNGTRDAQSGLGYELKVEDMEFDAIVNSVKSGKADFGAAGMTVTEDRKKSVDFTDPYTTAEQVVIVKK